MGDGEGGMIWENDIEIRMISYMKQVTSPGLMHDTGCLGLVHWDDPEGGYREGGGFRMGNKCIPVFLTQGLNPRVLHCRWILYHLATRLLIIS